VKGRENQQEYVFLSMRKITFLLFSLVAFSIATQAQSRLDSVDITHYSIHLRIKQVDKTIAGYTDISVVSKKNNIQNVTLDLLKLQVDSVMWDNAIATYQYNDTALRIIPASNFNTGNTATIRVYYHGNPVSDTKWGGFYFTGVYAFNMGVGFDAEPNSFGRVWFPCYDDFKSRATYDFFITAENNLTANCNGLLQSKTDIGNGLSTWHWKEIRRTPVYLVSVAVAPYASIKWTYKSRVTNKNIPVELYALPADTAKLLASFKNMDSAIAIYEDIFGPYPFDRIGYNIVPFNGGAMEHTGNIAYPLFAIDGNLTYETMMAHEFAHSWFGGLYNCATSSDMWLNEGWAVYSEHLFIERMYGKEAFKKAVRENLKEVLHFAHLQESGYRAVSGVPHAHTYGAHSYKKGAVIAHNYRESLFSNNTKSDINLHRFRTSSALPSYTHWNAQQFADIMMPGVTNNNYWYAARTLPDVAVRFTSKYQAGTSSYKVDLYPGINHLIAPSNLYNFPLCYTWFDSNRKRFDTCVYSHQPLTVFSANKVEFVAINFEELINFSITAKNKEVYQNDSVDFEEALMRLKINTCTDSALVRVEHHWYPADQRYCKIPGLFVSNYRYWTVDGIWPSNFNATAYITYDGRKPVNFGATGYLDHTFIRKTEDSLVLLYRPNAISDWQLYSDIVKTTGSKTDKYGNIRISNLKKGEYALGMYDVSLGEPSVPLVPTRKINVFPNPSEGRLHINWENIDAALVCISDITGRNVASVAPLKNAVSAEISLTHLPAGMYFVSVRNSENVNFTEKIILK
jgi:hypothetical protein